MVSQITHGKVRCENVGGVNGFPCATLVVLDGEVAGYGVGERFAVTMRVRPFEPGGEYHLRTVIDDAVIGA